MQNGIERGNLKWSSVGGGRSGMQSTGARWPSGAEADRGCLDPARQADPDLPVTRRPRGWLLSTRIGTSAGRRRGGSEPRSQRWVTRPSAESNLPRSPRAFRNRSSSHPTLTSPEAGWALRGTNRERATVVCTIAIPSSRYSSTSARSASNSSSLRGGSVQSTKASKTATKGIAMVSP